MVCYRGEERRGQEKGKIREIEQHTLDTMLHACTHLACPTYNYIMIHPERSPALLTASAIQTQRSQNSKALIFRGLVTRREAKRKGRIIERTSEVGQVYEHTLVIFEGLFVLLSPYTFLRTGSQKFKNLSACLQFFLMQQTHFSRGSLTFFPSEI